LPSDSHSQDGQDEQTQEDPSILPWELTSPCRAQTEARHPSVKRFATLHPAEDQITMLPLQGGPKWAIAGNDKLRRCITPLQRTIGLDSQLEVFLRCHPSDIEHSQPRFRYTSPVPQRGAATFGAEQGAIDAAIKHMDVLESISL
jgi:hypothetical protein